MNIMDNGNRKKAKDICAHKYCESGSAVGSRFPNVVCSKSVTFPARLPKNVSYVNYNELL